MSRVFRMLQVKVPNDLFDQAKSVAQRHDTTVSAIVRELLAGEVRAAGFDPPLVGRRRSDRQREQMVRLVDKLFNEAD